MLFVTQKTLAKKTRGWMKLIARKNVHKWPFDIDSAVLLVIDMQGYFLGERERGFCAGGGAIIPNVQRLISHFRKNGRPVVFTRHAHKKDGSDLGILKKWWPEMPMDGTLPAEIDERIYSPPPQPSPLKGEGIMSASTLSSFKGEVAGVDKIFTSSRVEGAGADKIPSPFRGEGKGGGEYILTKNRYSAFYNTKLNDILRQHKTKEVVITGVMTNICCESTARDAFYRDYMVRFVADATGSNREELHIGTLLNLAYAFADVCTTEELVNDSFFTRRLTR